MSKTESVGQSSYNFVAYLGHDLRSHLNAILGFTRLVQGRAQLEEKHRSSLQKVLLSAEQLLQLINKIVDLAKLESAMLQLHAAPVDLVALLDRITMRYDEHFQNTGLSLKKQWQSLPQLVLADEVYLQHALVGLIDNAVKFTERGQIVVAVDYQESRFRFSISDTGVGIEAERLQRFLANFVVAGDTAGTGLGIAYSKALIELMGGNLEAVSTPGKGSTFWFELELPLSEMQHDSAQCLKATPSARSPVHDIPDELRGTLHQLIREGDILGILDITSDLETNPQLADFAVELRTLAKGFQINRISDLLKTT